MRIKPAVGSVVGLADDSRWGQVLILPQVYGVVEIYDPQGKACDKGIAVLTKLAESCASIPVRLKDLEEIAKHTVSPQIVTLILLVVVGKVLYLVLSGKGGVYLKRGDKWTTLVREPGGISGEVKEDDTLLLVGGTYRDILGEEELLGVFDHAKASEIAEKLTLLLHEKTEQEGGAAFIFQVEAFVRGEEELEEQVSVTAQPVYETSFKARRKFTLGSVYQAVQRKGVLESVQYILQKLKAKTKAFLETIRFKKTQLIVGIVISLFLTSVGFGIRKQIQENKVNSASGILTEATRIFDEGVALLELNPVKGREKLKDAQTLLVPLIASNQKSKKQVSELYKKISDQLLASMHIVKAEPELFYDVGLLKKNGRIDSLSLSGDTLALLDKTNSTVYLLTIASKNGQVIAGGDSFRSSFLIASQANNQYVLTDTGIHGVTLPEKTSKTDIIKKDSEWGSIGSFVAFGGNLYLLDTQKGRIWKYVAIEKGFSDLREYLNPDTLPDLSNASNMSIDGSVWISTTNGKIMRFIQGQEATFFLKGVDPGLGNNLYLFTSDMARNVYVLDKDQKRIVVVDKEGTYLAQYTWDGNYAVAGMVVSEKDRLLLLLLDGKLYALRLT